MAQGMAQRTDDQSQVWYWDIFKFDSIENSEKFSNYIKNVQKPTFHLHIIRKKHLKIRK